MSILPACSGVLELVDLDESQKIFSSNELDLIAETVDILLIDTGAGISSNVLYFNMAAEESIVVVTPEPTSITDAYALIKVLSTNVPEREVSILINSAQNGQEAKEAFRKISMAVDRFLGSISLDYLGFVPFDEKLPARRQAPATGPGDLPPGSFQPDVLWKWPRSLMEKPVPVEGLRANPVLLAAISSNVNS